VLARLETTSRPAPAHLAGTCFVLSRVRSTPATSAPCVLASAVPIAPHRREVAPRRAVKERNVELLKQKIAVYGTLIDRLESIMRKGEVSLEDEIAIQMLNLKLSFFASTEVLQKFNEFARQFSLVAADRKVTGEERTELLGTLGELSTSIRPTSRARRTSAPSASSPARRSSRTWSWET
jgi:hypothetical protein